VNNRKWKAGCWEWSSQGGLARHNIGQQECPLAKLALESSPESAQNSSGKAQTCISRTVLAAPVPRCFLALTPARTYILICNNESSTEATEL
jgi:hypothetical protein